MGVAAVSMAAAFTACDKCADNSCKTATDSVSTAYGDYVGSMINADFARFQDNEKSDKEAFLRGMQIVFGADNSQNSQMGMQVALKMSAELDAAHERSKADNDNVKAGKEYVEKFKAENAEANTTATGLTYLIENAGEAPTPAENATVVVNYTGKHINGEIFDSSEGRGPATFNLQGVVPGFREGLMLLGKGGKATLVMPADLAYGANGTPDGSIQPNETLIFEVELLDIQ